MGEIQTQDRRLSVVEAAIRAEEARFDLALPSFMRGQKDRFLQLAVEMATRPDLAKCSPVSIIAGVMKAAQCGLPLDGTHAALTPFKGTATFVPMYQGLIAAAMRNGGVQKLWSAVVYEGDEFSEVLGSDPKLTHVPSRGNRTIDKAQYAYACAKLPSGEITFEVMDRDQILAIKAASKAANGPWSDRHAEPEMWRKTVVRRLAKYLVKSPEFQAVLDADEEFEPREAEARDLGPSAAHLPPAGAKSLRDLVPPTNGAPAPRTVDVTPKPAGDGAVPPEKWFGPVRIALTKPASEWIDSPIRTPKGDLPLDGLTFRQVAASNEPKVVADREKLLETGAAQTERSGGTSEFIQKIAEACRLHQAAQHAAEQAGERADEYAAEGSQP